MYEVLRDRFVGIVISDTFTGTCVKYRLALLRNVPGTSNIFYNASVRNSWFRWNLYSDRYFSWGVFEKIINVRLICYFVFCICNSR